MMVTHEQVPPATIHVGLDVAKLTLQVDLAGRDLALPNTPAGLAALVARRDQLKELVALEARRIEHHEQAVVKKEAALLAKQLAAHLEKIEAEISAVLAASAEVKARVERLTQVAGVGAVTRRGKPVPPGGDAAARWANATTPRGKAAACWGEAAAPGGNAATPRGIRLSPQAKAALRLTIPSSATEAGGVKRQGPREPRRQPPFAGARC